MRLAAVKIQCLRSGLHTGRSGRSTRSVRTGIGSYKEWRQSYFALYQFFLEDDSSSKSVFSRPIQRQQQQQLLQLRYYSKNKDDDDDDDEPPHFPNSGPTSKNLVVDAHPFGRRQQRKEQQGLIQTQTQKQRQKELDPKHITSSSKQSRIQHHDQKEEHQHQHKHKHRQSTKVIPRLPPVENLNEFSDNRMTRTPYISNSAPITNTTNTTTISTLQQKLISPHQSTMRILQIAANRLIEPPTLQLLVLTACATMGIASMEAILMCQDVVGLSSLLTGTMSSSTTTTTATTSTTTLIPPSAFIDTWKFIFFYSIHQLVPSIVWDSQDPFWIVQSLSLDPATIFTTDYYHYHQVSDDGINTSSASVSPSSPSSSPSLAMTLLQIHFLQTTRYFVAGFMMIASIVRAAGVSAGALTYYEEQIRKGREPPLPIISTSTATATATATSKLFSLFSWKNNNDQQQQQQKDNGVVIRFCGRDSYTTELSLEKMGIHLLPIFENPDRVQYLVWRHSENFRRPVYWCVKEGKYGSAFSFDQFPVHPCMLAPPIPPIHNHRHSKTKKDDSVRGKRNAASSSSSNSSISIDEPHLLIMEADATNPHDPLALGNTALDLNLDDASQGFRRIQERFTAEHDPKNFRTLRVYLGNSLEISRTGGGHAYTLRHRVAYTKEVDVLIDSRAPVLDRILNWCKRVAGDDRRIFFQTSSTEYFQSLQKILRFYGYEIYDPLDLRSFWQTQQALRRGKSSSYPSMTSNGGTVPDSLVNLLLDDPHKLNLAHERGIQSTLNLFNHSEYPSHLMSDEDVASMDGLSSFDEKTHPEMLRHVARLAHMPRLVHMPTTAETVNALEALVTAGEVDASHCCAILERQEGVAALEHILKKKSHLVRGERHQEWVQEESICDDEKSSSQNSNKTEAGGRDKRSSRWDDAHRHRRGGNAGLQMICTSTIYDDLFRQVRIWARMGFTNAQIQKEMDIQFHEILDYSHEAQRDKLIVTDAEETIDHMSTGVGTDIPTEK